jgi:CheY-like chemotaxis protein
LTVHVPERPIWIDADLTRIAQALSNLLSNAAKYTEPGGQITVAASANEEGATVTVTDTGIGIPRAMLPRIFDMFTQLQAHRDRTYGGLGIGLTLSRRLVQLHGGTITASSDGPGHGSQFTVRLPLANLAAEDGARGGGRGHRARGAMPRPGCRRQSGRGGDDEPDARHEGHDVRVAADGEEAVAIGTAFEPQIAFVDIGMPRMDGFEVARRLRERLGRRVLLVALTGWGQDEDRRRSREAGLRSPPDEAARARRAGPDDCRAHARTRRLTSGAGQSDYFWRSGGLVGRHSRGIQPHRLHERAVTRGVPHREAHPRFACRIKRNREVLGAECADVGR